MMVFRASRLQLCLLFFSGLNFAHADPTVTIASGVVIGTSTSVPAATASVNQFLGIPFAVSPPERFSPPVSPKAWKDPLLATQRKDSCMQQFDYPEGFHNLVKEVFSTPMPTESEDCLHLNVFTPATPPPAGGRAVMFWLYGGGLKFGYSGMPAYDGSSLAANQDVIVVTTNYRTNVFGFPNAPEQRQNLGFLDQRKALDWVQQNIAAFGGDPKKVTVFGESAGGYSIKQLLTFPPSPLNFRAAIMESPGGGLPVGGTLSWRALVNGLDCTRAASQFDCVKRASAIDIKNIIEQGSLNFAPVPDNVTYSPTISDAIINGNAAQVPLMIGTNQDEATIAPAVIAKTVGAWLEETFPDQKLLQLILSAAYPAFMYGSPARILSAIGTDLVMTCPASALANLAKDNGYSVYRYHFEAPFPNFQPFLGAGAFHTSEIQEVFGTYARENATAQQIALSEYMQTAWARFAKDPSGGPGWEKLGTKMEALGAKGSYSGEMVEQSTIDKHCPLFAPFIAV